MSKQQYDLVIIGAGAGGLIAAGFAVQLGAKVALVEKDRIGGDCTWTGCVPSKALLKAAKVAHEVRTAVRYGVVTSPPTVNMCEVREYVRGAIQAVYQFETPEGLDLEKAGVEYSPHGVSVDDRLRTNVKHIYAAGDVTGSYQFTHYAGWQAFQAVRNALLPGSSSGVSSLVPWVTVTDPEVAHIGATEEQARTENGNRVSVYRRELCQVDRAVCENDLSGFLKIITKPDGAILGASIVSARSGEAIAEIIVAMKQRMKIGDLAGTIHPYPTYSTAVQQMAADIAVQHQLSGTSGKLLRWLSKAVR